MSITKLTIKNFSLEKTLECGQCFRFMLNNDNRYMGVIDSKGVSLEQIGNTIIAKGEVSYEELSSFFTMDVDYTKIEKIMTKDNTLKHILEYSSGIRVLRQPLFEALITFILSSNNNIKRITSLVASLCLHFGKQIDDNLYDFPSPEVLASLNIDELSVIRCGFRDKYILDASRKWVEGDISGETISLAPLEEAREELMKIKGVGPKVADCTLLFGASRFDAFPKDVWIKRAMKELFPCGLPESLEEYAGIVQQYIFYYARNMISDSTITIS